jgi:hypothetical protein
MTTKEFLDHLAEIQNEGSALDELFGEIDRRLCADDPRGLGSDIVVCGIQDYSFAVAANSVAGHEKKVIRPAPLCDELLSLVDVKRFRPTVLLGFITLPAIPWSETKVKLYEDVRAHFIETLGKKRAEGILEDLTPEKRI